jgi:peptidoglycan glycosyltransferase
LVNRPGYLDVAYGLGCNQCLISDPLKHLKIEPWLNRLASSDVRQSWVVFLRSCLKGDWQNRPKAIHAAWGKLLQREARLEVWSGDQSLHSITLAIRRYRIGRDPACELPVEAPGLSRVHAILEKDQPADQDFYLEDFDSANGIFHRDRRVTGMALRDGDVVTLGSPLKAQAPRLIYHHPRSALGQAIHLVGIGSLLGSGVLVSGLLMAATVGGGSEIRNIAGPVKIYSANGQQVDSQEGSSTALPSLKAYPIHLRQALLASEEARFGWNTGIDLFGTARSALRRSGGGSGITQQVARIYYPTVGNDLSLTRKLRELWVALQLEVGFSKNQILKMYLDRAYLGLGANGFEQASRLYFRKHASQLDVPEAAFLVGLLPSPNGYSPCNRKDPMAGRERRNLVLGLMHEQGYLSDQGLIDAKRRPLNIDPTACRETRYSSYPFFSDYVRQELEGTRFGLNLSDQKAGGNYYVVSTINPQIQALAQQELRRFLQGPAAAAGLTEGALISLNYQTGEILAYVGGGDYSRSSFDRVQALRQPGSTFKLFPYLAALGMGAKATDQISCAPLGYISGCKYGAASSGGTASMLDGLITSENVVALRLGEKAGLANVLHLARLLGVSTKLDADYNTMLGGRETYLYEMARAYAVVANGGQSVPMHGVNRIYDLGICQSIMSLATCPERGITIPIGESSRQLISAEDAQAMDAMLAAVVQSGTGAAAGIIADARGKTGTTNDGVDVLFIGYSPAQKVLTAIWMGNDNNKPSKGASGALVAQLWGSYMQKVAALN